MKGWNVNVQNVTKTPPQYSTVLPTGTLRGKSSEAFSSPDQLETGDGADHFRAVDNRPIRARWEV
jgi:hypothetical protein